MPEQVKQKKKRPNFAKLREKQPNIELLWNMLTKYELKLLTPDSLHAIEELLQVQRQPHNVQAPAQLHDRQWMNENNFVPKEQFFPKMFEKYVPMMKKRFPYLTIREISKVIANTYSIDHSEINQYLINCKYSTKDLLSDQELEFSEDAEDREQDDYQELKKAIKQSSGLVPKIPEQDNSEEEYYQEDEEDSAHLIPKVKRIRRLLGKVKELEAQVATHKGQTSDSQFSSQSPCRTTPKNRWSSFCVYGNEKQKFLREVSSAYLRVKDFAGVVSVLRVKYPSKARNITLKFLYKQINCIIKRVMDSIAVQTHKYLLRGAHISDLTLTMRLLQRILINHEKAYRARMFMFAFHLQTEHTLRSLKATIHEFQKLAIEAAKAPEKQIRKRRRKNKHQIEEIYKRRRGERL